MKKLLSLILSFILVLTAFTPSFGATTQKELYNQSGEILKSIGVLEGSETGDLMLNQKLKRQDMVVLISRLYKKESIAKKYQGKDIFTDVKSSFYKPYISWAVNEGLIIGMGNNQFGFNSTVKVQDFQVVLLRALGYGDEVKNYSNVPNLAETFDLMKNISATPRQDLERGLMAAMTLNALRATIKGSSTTLAQKLNLKIPDPFEVNEVATIDKNVLKLEGIAKGINGLKVNLKPVSSNISSGETDYNISLKGDGRFIIEIPNLQSGKYEYKFISGNMSTQPKTITIQELPFEITDIKADNLKEITINFTSPIDKLSSLFPSNYFTNAGAIKSVRLENNDTTVILTLADGITMENQKSYNLTINRIKPEKGKELNIKDREFLAFDNSPPKVNKVVQLGSKGLRVYMSEPIKFAKSSNFKLNSKNFSGQVELADNVITLKYYSTSFAPKEGKHVLNVLGLEDFAEYRMINQDISFDIVNDTEAPNILDARATMEEAIIEFDEEIDPSSVTRTSFYWKSGSSKRYPSSIKVVNNKVLLNFSGNTLPIYEISIHIDSIADYSGNKLTNGEVKVVPVIDTTNPEVVGLTVADDGKSITVYYSKNVVADNRNFYIIKDRNNKNVNIRNVEGSGREYKVNLYNPLPIGLNTITIQDVYDTTTLKNRLIAYSQQIDMDDVEKPIIVSHSGKDRQIMLRFNKEMDLETVTNYENYLIKIGDKYVYLPRDTEFSLVNDEKTVLMELPEKIDDKKVDIGRLGNIREIQIRGLRGINNILIDPITLTFDGTNKGEAQAEEAILIEPDTIKVVFNQPIYSASPSDFSVLGRSIYDVRPDGSNELIVILDDKDETYITGSFRINDKNSIETILDTGVKPGTLTISDQVPPAIKSDIEYLYINRNTIELPFTERLDRESSHLFHRDLIVEDYYEGILDESDYETSLDTSGTVIRISIKKSVKSSDRFSVKLVDEPRYIMDASGNVVEPSDYDYLTR